MTKHNIRVLLIGGTSHSGKSTLAAVLAQRLGWHQISTDQLARHPGRPWRTPPDRVPAHVADHYRSLSVDALLDDVLRHYQRLWPTIESIITAHATDPSAECVVMEGSALWPEAVATLSLDTVAAVWLTATPRLLQERIAAESRLEQAAPPERWLIEQFAERTLRYNERMLEAIKHLGLPSIDVEALPSPDALVEVCLKLVRT
jgi:2-phosphoglycerate kinase